MFFRIFTISVQNFSSIGTFLLRFLRFAKNNFSADVYVHLAATGVGVTLNT
jgi:hypothetical protein